MAVERTVYLQILQTSQQAIHNYSIHEFSRASQPSRNHPVDKVQNILQRLTTDLKSWQAQVKSHKADVSRHLSNMDIAAENTIIFKRIHYQLTKLLTEPSLQKITQQQLQEIRKATYDNFKETLALHRNRVYHMSENLPLSALSKIILNNLLLGCVIISSK